MARINKVNCLAAFEGDYCGSGSGSGSPKDAATIKIGNTIAHLHTCTCPYTYTYVCVCISIIRRVCALVCTRRRIKEKCASNGRKTLKIGNK